MKVRTRATDKGLIQELVSSSEISTFSVSVPIVDSTGTTIDNFALDIVQLQSGSSTLSSSVASLESNVLDLQTNGVFLSFLNQHFGDGEDGDLVVSNSTTTSGPLTNGYLTRDAYFNNLTMAAGGVIKPNGFRIFVKETLDLSNASSACFYVPDPPIAGSGSPQGGGPGGSADITVAFNVSSNYITTLLTFAGTTGGNGGTIAGLQGNNTQGALYVSYPGGVSGAGGAGSSGAGALGRDPALNFTPYRWKILGLELPRTIGNTVRGAQSGAGGGGGGGDGGGTGGGGGGGGGGGSTIALSAKTILTGLGTASGLFYSVGGMGGMGGTPSSGNRGGGGGGSGGSGGLIVLTYLQRTGPAVPNAFTVNGGAGGLGGSPSGTGSPGTIGGGGAGGAVVICNATTGVCTTHLNTTPASGTTGGYTTAAL